MQSLCSHGVWTLSNKFNLFSSSWDGRPFDHNRHWPKIGGLHPLFGEGELGPHLAQCGLGRGLPPYQLSGILIRPAVWPQYTNVTDRETGQIDRTGQRSNSIRRIILKTVTQNLPTLANQMWWLHLKYISAESKSLPILGRCGLTFMPLQLTTRCCGTLRLAYAKKIIILLYFYCDMLLKLRLASSRPWPRPTPRLDLQDRDFNIWVSRRLETKTEVSRTTSLIMEHIIYYNVCKHLEYHGIL